ncbi:MAG: hypothetical protein UX89_C0010G0029 [Parcubacteria group bacterium GW2011_GWA2_47_16]|nr:MAG: hypothetical protein UX89_C0010G0029 [Parcubacteria group bacterium GW2011_GWA2_47_16]
MAKKVSFPRVEECETIFDLRLLLSQVRWRSPEYRALMSRWRRLCFEQMLKLELNPGFSSLLEGGKARVWRKVYELCPSGSPEEAIALGAWQGLMSYDADLVSYRQRVCSQARKVGRSLGLFY